MLVVPSASEAEPVMPTTVPTVAFSLTALAVPSDVRDRADVEFVEIGDGDCDGLCIGRDSIGDLDRDVVDVVATDVGGLTRSWAPRGTSVRPNRNRSRTSSDRRRR